MSIRKKGWGVKGECSVMQAELFGDVVWRGVAQKYSSPFKVGS